MSVIKGIQPNFYFGIRCEMRARVRAIEQYDIVLYIYYGKVL